MSEHQFCKECGKLLPKTREFFGSTPSNGFRRKCRACMSVTAREHQLDNPLQEKNRRELREQRINANGGSYSDHDILLIRQFLNDKCAYCLVELNGKGVIDHMQPVAKGGHSNPDNITICCNTCNAEKHAKNIFEYYAWRINHGLSVDRNWLERVMRAGV